MLEGLWSKECLLCFGDHKNNSGNYRTLAISCNVREGFRAQPCTALNQSKAESHLWSSEAVWPLSSGLPFLRHRPPHLSNDCCEPSVQAHGLLGSFKTVCLVAEAIASQTWPHKYTPKRPLPYLSLFSHLYHNLEKMLYNLNDHLITKDFYGTLEPGLLCAFTIVNSLRKDQAASQCGSNEDFAGVLRVGCRVVSSSARYKHGGLQQQGVSAPQCSLRLTCEWMCH